MELDPIAVALKFGFIAVLWWVLFTALATWLLLRTRFGNWVFATGGDVDAARNVGVRTTRTTLLLFLGTATAAWFVGTTMAVRLTSVQANAGIGEELIYIVAAVIGGCLLTGGFGSAVGASLGALIFGMTELGIAIGDKSAWGQGYGSEAVRLMCDYGFTFLGLHTIYLWHVAFNERGHQAYLKAGFKEAGRLRGADVFAGQR